MAIKSDLFLIVILAANHFYAKATNPQCLKFSEGEVTLTGFKFSLENICQTTDLPFIAVEVKSSGTSKLLCNIVTRAGTCSPSDICTCNGRTDYQVTRRVEDETLDEVWTVSGILANEDKFRFTVDVKGSKGTNGNRPSGPKTVPSSSRTTTRPPGNGGSAERKTDKPTDNTDIKTGDVNEKTNEDPSNDGNTVDSNQTLEETKDDSGDLGILGAKSGFDFIVLGSIAGLLILIVVVFVIVCKMKGQTPASAVRAIRRSLLFEHSYHVRRPVADVHYSQPEGEAHTENHYGNVGPQANAGGATPNRNPVAMGNQQHDVRPDSFPDFPPPPSSLDAETLDSSSEWFDDNGQHDYYSNM